MDVRRARKEEGCLAYIEYEYSEYSEYKESSSDRVPDIIVIS